MRLFIRDCGCLCMKADEDYVVIRPCEGLDDHYLGVVFDNEMKNAKELSQGEAYEEIRKERAERVMLKYAYNTLKKVANLLDAVRR